MTPNTPDVDGRLLRYLRTLGVLRITPEGERFSVTSAGGKVHLAPVALIELGVEMIVAGTKTLPDRTMTKEQQDEDIARHDKD